MARTYRSVAHGRANIPRTPIVLLVTALILGLGQQLVLGDDRAGRPPGGVRTEVASTGVGPADSPDVSADGRSVAFATEVDDQLAGAPSGFGGTGIYVRDLAGGRAEQVVPAQPGTRVAAPSLSGDGRLLAFASSTDGATELMVANRTDPRKVTTNQITGGVGDLPFQRTIACAGGSQGRAVRPPAEHAAACGPELSADGRTVVFPSRLAVPSPWLGLSTLDGNARRELTGEGRTLPVLTLSSDGHGTALVLQVGVNGPTPLAFHVPTIAPEAGFAILGEGTTCGADPAALVAPGAACTVTVRFAPGVNCGPPARFSTLTINGPSAAARTALALVGIDTRPGCAATDRASSSSGCANTARPRGGAGAVRARPAGPAGAAPLGEVEVGESRLVAVQVKAPQKTGSRGAVLSFVTSGCDVALVVPRRTPAGPACKPGDKLVPPLLDVAAEVRDLVRATVTVPPGAAGCTAYLRVAPTSVQPFAGALVLRPRRGGPARVVPVAGTGALDVVLQRRDPTGAGQFARPDSVARVVSVDAAGNHVSGGEPAVSGDGRYVAFTSPARGPGRQVLRHDTDALGNGSGRPGATSVVSYLTGRIRALPLWARAAALSDDGRSVAFEALPAAVGREPEACSCTRVFVRDVESARTYGFADGTVARHHMEAPALAGDGSTLAFRVRPDRSGASGAVFVRDLGPDRDGPGERRSEQLPVDLPGADAGQPDLDAHGGVLAWQVSSPPAAEGLSSSSRVLAQTRYGTGVVTPGPLAFGPQEVGSSSEAKSVTVTNAGPGPLRVAPEGDGPVSLRDGCAALVLHRDEFCVIDVVFHPTDVGAERGSVQVNTTSSGVVERRDVVLMGNAIEPVLEIEPRSLLLPPSSLGIFGRPLRVQVRNTGPEPVMVTASSSSGEFVVREGCREQLEPGGRPCLLTLAFAPGDVGRRTATLAVSWVPASGDESPPIATEGRPRPLIQTLPMAAETRVPTLVFAPPVAVAGRVSMLLGRHLPPGAAIRVEDAGGRLVATGRTNAAGLMRVAVVLFTAQPLGPWQLSARIGEILVLRPPPLLVVPGAFQPPDFSRRN